MGEGIPEPGRGGSFLYCPAERCGRGRILTARAYRRHWRREHEAGLPGWPDEAARFSYRAGAKTAPGHAVSSAEPGRAVEAGGGLAGAPPPAGPVTWEEVKNQELIADLNRRLGERRRREGDLLRVLGDRVLREPASLLRASSFRRPGRRSS